MSSLHWVGARVLVVVVCGLLGACGSDAVPEETFEPGVGGAALDGSIEVIVVDERTHRAIDATIEIVHAGGSLGPLAGDGRFAIDDDALRGALSIHVTGVERPQALVGVTGSRVVIPIAVASLRTIEGTVAGAGSLGAHDVVVGALVPPSFVRTDVLGAAATSSCVLDASGCRFRIDGAPDTTDTLVATLRDDAGAAIAFGIGAPGPSAVDPSRLDLSEASSRVPAIDLEVASPPAPPIGLEAVVGVPGLVTPSGLALLDQTPTAAGTVGVPELAGTIADGSWWLLAEAAPSPGDRTTRSVILQRGLRRPEDVGAWPAWLAPPEVAIEGGVPAFTAVPGATIHVVDWLASDGAVLASALVLDPTLLAFAPPVAASAIRVRAIDAPYAGTGALDLASVEGAVVRFSESVVTP